MTDTGAPSRSRTFDWTDPARHATEVGRRDGLEVLSEISSGVLPPPPVMRMLGMERIEVAAGRATVYLTPQEFHYNPLGCVHGGVLATLLDTATGCAVHTTLPAGTGYTSLDLSTRFLRPVTVHSGLLRGEGTVLSRGRRTAVAEAKLFDGEERLVAHAVSTCLLFETQTSR